MPSEWQLQGRTQYSWTDTSALQNLHLNNNVPKPTDIPAGHALVRIRAAALNARDMAVIAHDSVYPGPHRENLVPCADGAGEVEAVGEGSVWKAGDKVVISACSWMDWKYGGDEEIIDHEATESKGAGDIQGTLREYAVLADDHLIRAPDHLSFEELASLPAAGATAVHALFDGPKPLKKGQTVLAQGTGGVSCFVIQLAHAIGATVIATSSTDEKLKLARQLGAAHTINYRTYPNWEDEVLRITNGRGVDIVVEVAGSSTIEQSVKSTKRGGLVTLVGFLTENKNTDLVQPIIFGGKTLYGVCMFTTAMTRTMVELVGEKKIHPAVGKVFEWEDAKAAFELLAKQGAVGKIVIKVGEKD